MHNEAGYDREIEMVSSGLAVIGRAARMLRTATSPPSSATITTVLGMSSFFESDDLFDESAREQIRADFGLKCALCRHQPKAGEERFVPILNSRFMVNLLLHRAAASGMIQLTAFV